MRKEPCSNCGGEAHVRRGNFRYDQVGIPVLLLKIDLAKCPNCHNVDPIISNLDGLMDAVASGLVNKPYRLTGKEIRFLRKYLGKSQQDFSRLVRVDSTTISKWENAQTPPSASADRLIRLLILSMSDRLEEPREKIISLLSTAQETRRELKRPLLLDVATGICQFV